MGQFADFSLKETEWSPGPKESLNGYYNLPSKSPNWSLVFIRLC